MGRAKGGGECGECDRCGAWLAKQKKCSGCKAVCYCDALCQKAAWKTHKKACKAAEGGAGASGEAGERPARGPPPPRRPRPKQRGTARAGEPTAEGHGGEP